MHYFRTLDTLAYACFVMTDRFDGKVQGYQRVVGVNLGTTGSRKRKWSDECALALLRDIYLFRWDTGYGFAELNWNINFRA
jgi:hypothetical protein